MRYNLLYKGFDNNLWNFILFEFYFTWKKNGVVLRFLSRIACIAYGTIQRWLIHNVFFLVVSMLFKIKIV